MGYYSDFIITCLGLLLYNILKHATFILALWWGQIGDFLAIPFLIFFFFSVVFLLAALL